VINSINFEHKQYLMKIFLSLFLFLPVIAFTQNYYRDIIGTAETNEMMRLYKERNVASVSSHAYNENSQPVTGFSEKQQVYAEKNMLNISRTYESGSNSSEWLHFDTAGRLVKHIDSSGQFRSETGYTYDDKGRINVIQNVSVDTAININETELHLWHYGPDGLPVKMIRVLNTNDTTEFRLTADEKGNIIEETAYKKNTPGEKIYYYYNDNNQLTDVVRYNRKAGRLLPDLMFEYSETGQVIQKITTLSNPKVGYLIWRYQFDTNGLKQREANFNKEKKLIGRIDYRYEFAK
jgi:YD repeat-containing protein